jgi:hypothetical protein
MHIIGRAHPELSNSQDDCADDASNSNKQVPSAKLRWSLRGRSLEMSGLATPFNDHPVRSWAQVYVIYMEIPTPVLSRFSFNL